MPIPSPVLCQASSPYPVSGAVPVPVPNPLSASSPGLDPVEGTPGICTHTDAQSMPTTDTEGLDRRYSGTSVLSNGIDTNTIK